MEAAETKINDMIRENAIVVFSKSYCPHCKATKDLLNRMSITHKVYELDLEADGAVMQDKLQVITEQRSVPNIYVKGAKGLEGKLGWIGGNSDLQARKSELPAMAKEAEQLQKAVPVK